MEKHPGSDSELDQNRDIDKEIQDTLAEFRKFLQDPKSDEDHESQAYLASRLATLYSEIDQMQEALRYYLMGLREFEKIEDKHNAALVRGSIGSLYLHMGDYVSAKKFTERAYEYWKTANYLNERIACLQNLGIIFLNLGEESKAVDLVLNAMKMSMQLQDETQFALSIQILLEYYERLEKYDILKELKLKALQFWESLNIIPRQIKTLIDVGVLSQILNECDEALVLFKKAFNVAYKANDAEKMLLAQGFLAETYFKKRNLELAHQTYLEAFKLAVYLDTQKNHKNDVDQMRVALLALGSDAEELEKEESKVRKEHTEKK